MEELGFEEAYGALEEVVSRLEAGAETLDEALELYEEGNRLAQHCATLLEQAELRVRQLREREDGGFDEEPFDLVR